MQGSPNFRWDELKLTGADTIKEVSEFGKCGKHTFCVNRLWESDKGETAGT